MALPSAKHEVKTASTLVCFRQLPRQGPVSNNNNTRPSALAETRGCYQLARAWDFVCSSRVFLSTVLAQDPGREPHDWMIRIYHHTSQLRANSERAPLNSPSVSGHRLLRVSPGLLLSSFGAVLLLSSSCVVLCVLICPDPSLRCCASLLLRPRPSFSLCVEAAVVCVAGGRRHEIAARAALL